MAYRYEKNKFSGKSELVIDGFEKGIADSPFEGITSIKNFNISYLTDGAYANYKRNKISTTAGSGTFIADATADTITVSGLPNIAIGDAFTVTTTGTLPAPLTVNTTYYAVNSLVRLGTLQTTFQISLTPMGSIINITNTGTGVHTLTTITPGAPVAWTQSQDISPFFALVDTNVRVWYLSTGQINFDTGEGAYWILLDGNTRTSSNHSIGIGYFKGYLFVFRGGNIDYCKNPFSSPTWTDAWQAYNTGYPELPVANLWAANDDIFYFASSSNVGSLQEVAGMSFDPSDPATYIFNAIALKLPTFEVITWLDQLGVNLMISTGGGRIYPWDRTSTGFGIPLFINEFIYRTKNIRNIIYVLAGYKGNIYSTNGYSISLFKKIPDSFTGSIDPQYIWGDIMAKRNKLYFGFAQAKYTSAGVWQAGGVFGIGSIDVSTEQFFFENQNSCGLTQVASAKENTNVLIDMNLTSYDSFLSAWYNNSIGGMDFNTRTPYTNFEPVIETDLIPVGTTWEPITFEEVEYKLDRPLVSGDQIRLSFRTSFTDSYTLIGTTDGTTTQVLSEGFSSNINIAQWVQFKVEVACASSGSSFTPLRELRLH